MPGTVRPDPSTLGVMGERGYSYTTCRRLLRRRGIATRFDKRAANYRAAVVIVSLVLWLG
jgi:transposase